MSDSLAAKILAALPEDFTPYWSEEQTGNEYARYREVIVTFDRERFAADIAAAICQLKAQPVDVTYLCGHVIDPALGVCLVCGDVHP